MPVDEGRGENSTRAAGEVENVHSYIFGDPVRAIREALQVIAADRENLLAEVERLNGVVYRLQGADVTEHPVFPAAVPDVTALALEKLRQVAADETVISDHGFFGDDDEWIPLPTEVKPLVRFTPDEAAALLALVERTRQERDEAHTLLANLVLDYENDDPADFTFAQLVERAEGHMGHGWYEAGKVTARAEAAERERDAAEARERELREALQRLTEKAARFHDERGYLASFQLSCAINAARAALAAADTPAENK